MDLLLSLKQTARKFPDLPAVVDGDVRMNWHEYEQETRHLAAGLAELGIRSGDRVAILALNGYRYLALYHGVLRLGGIVVPLNTRFSSAEYVYTLNNSGAIALVVDDAFLHIVDTISAQLQTVQHYIVACDGSCPSGMQTYRAILVAGKNAVAYEDVQPDEDDVFGLFYTGGTTGHAKGVMLTHKNMMINNMQMVIANQFPTPLNHLHTAPLFHVADALFIFLVTMLGGCHTFLPSFRPTDVLRIIQRENITHSVLVPTMVQMLIQEPTIHDYDLTSLQQIVYGGSPIAIEVLRHAMKLLPCRFLQIYGMTEASPIVTMLSWEAHLQALQAEPGSPVAQRLLSAGQPVVGSDARIVNEQGQEVAVGEIGEVIVRGPNVMKGYWEQAGESAYGLRDGWLHTGDLARRDDHAFFYIVDRKKDMIITGGENVYSTEVENALYRHPAVLEVAVIGVPDPVWGERVHAVVALKPGWHTTAEELITTCRKHIAGYKVPRSIEWSKDLPKSGAGKILKRILREHAVTLMH